jgi:hypothetical protein
VSEPAPEQSSALGPPENLGIIADQIDTHSEIARVSSFNQLLQPIQAFERARIGQCVLGRDRAEFDPRFSYFC